MVPNWPGASHESAFDTARHFLEGYDIHPPTIYLLFPALFRWGISEPALRLCNLAMTGLALALWQLVTLAIVSRRTEQPVVTSTRLVALLLFGLSPLALSQGDAIRWYPPFALCVALSATLYLGARSAAVRLAAAIPLGLAVAINLIAPLVAIPLAIYRYALQRQCRPAFDLWFWGIAAVFAAPGLYTAIEIARRNLSGLLRDKFATGAVSAIGTGIIGFFGGNTVGIGQAWLILPAAALTAIAAIALIDRRDPGAPVNFCLLLCFAAVAAMVAGFSEPRSFLYLAPVSAMIVTLFIDRQLSRHGASRALLLSCCAILPSIAAIADLGTRSHPFKRNAVPPFDEILAFIDRNKRGDTLVISTDPVVPWALSKQPEPQLCVSYFFSEADCFANPVRYQSIFVVSGHSSHTYDRRYMQRFAARVAEVTAGRERLVSVPVGRDEDAMLKTRLTGVPLDEFILTVDLYR